MPDDYDEAAATLIDALDAAAIQARDNGLTDDEIISEFELRIMAMKEESDHDGDR